MEIIDAHIHTDFKDELLQKAAEDSGVNFSLNGLKKEMASNNVVAAVSISIQFKEGNLDKVFAAPLFLKCPLENTITIAAINPYAKGTKQIAETEKLIKSGKIKGLKIYLGYFPFYPYDEIYLPFYKLAGKYNIPVIFHTGDTYSEKAKVKFAHPLNVDEIAVEFPQTKFVLAHFGNPWLMDAAEVVWKNKNVYADLAALALWKDNKWLGLVHIETIKEALEYCGYDRIIYGSDWPLVPMKPQLALIKKLVPAAHRRGVFFENARRLFNIQT